jgi:glutamine synthetase
MRFFSVGGPETGIQGHPAAFSAQEFVRSIQNTLLFHSIPHGMAFSAGSVSSIGGENGISADPIQRQRDRSGGVGAGRLQAGIERRARLDGAPKEISTQMTELGTSLWLERESPPDRSSVIERLRSERIELVDLVFSDIAGGAKSLTMPAEQLRAAMQHGYRFDGSAVMGGLRRVELDLLLMPDPATLLIVPGDEHRERRARLCCTVLRQDGEPFDGDPRSVLIRSLAAAREAGVGYRVGIEIEYYMVRGEVADPRPARDAAGYFDMGEDAVSRTRDAVVSALQAIGVTVGGAHHETGPGQEEIDLSAAGALEMADQLIMLRHIVRTVAQRNGLRAMFMAKPFGDAPGSGMHIFQHFHDPEEGGDLLDGRSGSLSDWGYRAIAGQLRHAAGMSAVLCPTVNSYKRLNAGHRAPRHASWATVSHGSMIRVPSWQEGQSAALELRSPDPMANPYLALTVALAAALDGARRGDQPPDPLEESFGSYDDGELQRIGVPRLPATLGEAIQAFSQDAVVQEALGPYIADELMAVKRAEWEEYRAYVGPWEHTRYGDA